ncbi:uncharacterized protein TNIN_109861 [Trichonephila inaurata madagascariensis]|uniref:Uncharacterized protein n=1 Tax=Trichonephila inaurata madagascariensis TaxID=2747483 RepID=A0A8X6WQL9_9ARAC|nr:uncharacterized protein TNIN_109861 [Trichonephila inaurata madagascariensis]
MEQFSNDNSLNFMLEEESSKDKNVTNEHACELNQKLSDNKEEFKKPYEEVNRKNGLKSEVVLHEIQLPEIQKDPINDRLLSDDLRFDMMNNESSDLKDKINELEAQNYQYRQLIRQKNEVEKKTKEQVKDLSNQLDSYQKMKNTLETRSTQLAKKENSYKKMARDNRKLSQVINQFAEKLSNAELLTRKDKRTLQNLAQNGSSCEKEFNSNDQEEMDDLSPSKSCKGNSSVPQSMDTSEHSYCAPVPRSLVVKNLESNEKSFQFSKKTSSYQKQSLQSISTQSFGANYRIKNCQDAIDYLNVPDVNVQVNKLDEMRHQLATMNRHFSPISPLPPTPPPKIIVSKYNQPCKDLTAVNPCTASVSSNQNSVSSDNQILQVFKAPSSSTPRKNKFRHQQSEGFEIPSEPLHDTSNLNPEDSKNGALNVTSSDSPNYINLNAERVDDNGLSLKFDVPSQLHLGIDLDSMHISCYIRNNQKSSSQKNSSCLSSEMSLINKQRRNVSSHLYDEGPYKKKSKVIIESPSSRGSFSKDFPSIERSKRVFTVNHDISEINTSDEDILKKEPSINFSQSCANDSHNLETNVRSQIQSFGNQGEHSRSSSSESPFPLKKKLKISESPQQYEKSPLENEERLSNFALETTKTSHNVHMDQHLLVDSVAETTINKKNSLQNLSRISTLNVKSNESEIGERSLSSKTDAVKSIANIHNCLEEKLFHETEQNKEFDVSLKKSKTSSVQSTTSKKDKKESLEKRKKKQGKTMVKKKTSLKRQDSEFVNLKVSVEREESIVLSANKLSANNTSLYNPTSITHNLEHAHEGVSSIGDPKSEILLDQNISNCLLPNKMTDSSNNCSPKYSVNKAAEKSPSKTEYKTFLQDTYLNNSIKNDLDVNEKESKRTPSTSEELFLNGHVLDFKEFDSSTSNLPHGKIVEQEIKVNSTDEYSFLKTSGMISQNTVFSNENNSCLYKSNNLMDNQLSVSETNEFIRPESNSCVDEGKSENCQLSTTETNEFTRLENSLLDKSNYLMDSQLSGSETNEFIRLESNGCQDKSNNLMGSQLSLTETNEFTMSESNNSPIKIKSSPLNSPVKECLIEASNVDFSGLSIGPFNPDTFTNTRNMQVNEEFSYDKNILCSQNNDKGMNFSVYENDKLNKITSLETKTSDDQGVENIRMNSFTLPAPDRISAIPFLISPIKEKNQYPNSKRIITSEMEEQLNNGRQQEDRFAEIDREKSFFKSDHVKEEINGMDTALDVKSEVGMKTQGISSRSSKKGQNFILSETELKKGLIGDQYASVNDDSKYLTNQISEMESDYELPLVIADAEVSHSSNDSEVENSEKIAKNSARESNLYVASSEIKNENPKENYNILSELPEIIQSVFETVEGEKIKSSNTRFKACVHDLVSVLTDPTNVENCQMLIYYLVIHLHLTKKNPIRYYLKNDNRDMLLPLTENCFVTALFLINQKNKPHLAGLIRSTVNTLCRLILVKTEYHIFGLSSLCRVLTAICKQLNDSKKIKLLCYHLFKHNHKYTPFLIATIVAVWPEAFAVSSDSPEEEDVFIRAIAYGCGQKPRVLTDAQWRNCKSVFSKFLNVEELHFTTNEYVDYLMKKVLNKALNEPTKDHFMLKCPLIIHSRMKGWKWTEKYLLKKYMVPSINSFKTNEKVFIHLTNFYVDFCFVFNEEFPKTYLASCMTSSSGEEFVRFYGGLALLKLICLSRTYFTSDLEKWMETYQQDSRARLCLDIFAWRMMLDSGLVLKDICDENVCMDFL